MGFRYVFAIIFAAFLVTAAQAEDHPSNPFVTTMTGQLVVADDEIPCTITVDTNEHVKDWRLVVTGCQWWNDGSLSLSVIDDIYTFTMKQKDH